MPNKCTYGAESATLERLFILLRARSRSTTRELQKVGNAEAGEQARVPGTGVEGSDGVCARLLARLLWRS